MKRPRKEPRNLNFWLGVLADPDKTKEFLDRAGQEAQRDLRLAMNWRKWNAIQRRKEEQEQKQFVSV